MKVDDLEHTRMDELCDESDVAERGVRGLANKEVVFRISGSEEYLLFEAGGFWHEEGINHKLLI